MHNNNSSDFRNVLDVTNHVRVNDPAVVADHACQLFTETYGDASEHDRLRRAFLDFARLFRGQFEGYRACDTLYHDIQHTLDMTLATARLINGHERLNSRAQLGKTRFVLGVVLALFHDSGYIRTEDDDGTVNGAIYTLTHVSRSGDFLRHYLPRLGLGRYADLATLLVHFTGYEMELSTIHVDDPKDRTLGWLLGTADLIAQMADRCYLEKCRDRLYPEFALAGLAGRGGESGHMVFTSPEDLLKKTPMFYRQSVLKRLNQELGGVHKFAGAFFDGTNPYMDMLDRNIGHLDKLVDEGDFRTLRRQLPATEGEEQFPFDILRDGPQP
ncbi:MAG: hypothetical protein ACFCUG_09890 [Thiotrichales bacterium]